MADHHRIEFIEEGGEGDEFFGEHLLFRAVDHGKFFVGIDFSGAVGGEVFSAGEDSLAAHGAIENACVVDDFLRVRAVAAAFKGIICFVIVGDIEDGTEIEIEAEVAEELSGDAAVLFDEGAVSFFTELLGVGGFLADFAEAGDAAAFLVDGDDWFDVREIAKVVGEFPELLRAFDVAGEEDEPTGLNALEAGGGLGIEFRSGDAGEEELTERECFHSVGDDCRLGRGKQRESRPSCRTGGIGWEHAFELSFIGVSDGAEWWGGADAWD